MQLTYEKQVKEPFILKLSTDEICLLRFHMKKAQEKVDSDARFFVRTKEKKMARGAARELKVINSFIESLEEKIKTLNYG